MKDHTILAAILLVPLLGCQRTLTLAVKNPDKDQSYELRYQVKEEAKQPEFIGIKTIGPEKTEKFIDKFDVDNEVTLQARQNNYIVWESGSYTMNKDRKDDLIIDVSKFGPKRFDPVSAAQELAEADKKFKELIVAKGYRLLVNVLNTDFGSFVAKKKGGTWFAVVGPDVYGGKKDLNWVTANIGAGGVRIQKLVQMNRTLTTQASGGYAIFQAKAGFTDSDFYEYSVNIDIVTLMHEDTFVTAKAKLALRSDDIAKAANAELDKYIGNDNYTVAFVRGIHYFKDYTVSYRKANKLAFNTSLTAGTFLDGSAAYEMSNTTTTDNAYKDMVGGFFYESDKDVLEGAVAKVERLTDKIDRVLAEEFVAGTVLSVKDVLFKTRKSDKNKLRRDAAFDTFFLSPERDKH